MTAKITADSELEQAHDLRIPAPLDPHISSVSIRTGSNNPAEHFDLLLSASFGSEYVTIESGEDSIEFKISIQKAELKLNGVNCTFSLFGVDTGRGEGWSGSERKTDSLTSQTSAEAGLTVSTSALGSPQPIAAKASAGISQVKSSEWSRSVQREFLPYRILSHDTIQIGYGDAFEKTVQGRIVDESIGVRVTPDTVEKPVGVLVRARVRERWIKIDDIRPIKPSSRLKKLWQVFESESRDAERKREMFGKLIAHLVAKQLQEVAEETNATLSAAAVVFSPVKASFQGVGSPQRSDRMRIDPTVIDRFLQSDESHEIQLLEEIGVDLGEDTWEEKFRKDFASIWERTSGAGYVYIQKPTTDIQLLDCIAASFGHIAEFEIEKRVIPAYTLTLTSPSKISISASKLVESLGSHWYSVASLVSCGALVKGERAFQIAKAFGFEYSYQTFQKRLRPFSYKSGYGYLVTYCDLLQAIGCEDQIKVFSGMTVAITGFYALNLAEIDEELEVPD